MAARLHHEKVLRWHSGSELEFGDNNIYTNNQRNPKTVAFARHPARNAFGLIHGRYYISLRSAIINNLYKIADTPTTTYSELYDLIQKIKEEVNKINVKDIVTYNYDLNPIKEIWDTIIPDLDKLQKELQDLQTFEGSDDDDLERAKDYNEKLKNPQHI